MTALSGLPRVRRRFRVSGVVQGVGFRPFVYVTATGLGLSGTVANDARGVVVEAEGDPSAVDELGRWLASSPPPLAIVRAVASVELEPLGHKGFQIIDSNTAAFRGVRTQVSPDVATCADCLRELADPADRRYRHPFISCTNCGPRWTIIRDLPYDRPLTTMAAFPMCATCSGEYADPTDRRFHAQPIACHDCGPRLELVVPGSGSSFREDALVAARELLAAGAVVAVKGLGGYHLACDARNESAVARLRARKRRGAKPFAVMVRDLDAVRELVDVDPLSARLLTGPRRPVVLLPRRSGAHRPGAVIGDSVAPGNPDLGLLLPYTPVHALLLEAGDRGSGPHDRGTTPDLLVMTSGNLGGEPIAYTDGDALERLAPLADAWLRHDREIHLPVDDSVTRVVDGREAPVRRSRGYAPLPIALPLAVPPTLASGADLKNTCAVGSGTVAWLSQHIGDLDDLATLAALDSCAAGIQQLVGVSVEQFATDAHPGYRSAAWARQRAAARPVAGPVKLVQHHHAHIASVMAEHGLDGSVPVIGVAFDGTGYGPDGAVWGGEVLVADYEGYRRAAHLRYVRLPGGDVAVQRPYRMALAHLEAAGVPWDDDLPPVAFCPDRERSAVAHQLRTGFGAAPTSSMGRLFDAVSSLAGVRHEVDFEAQAAIELEALARGVSLSRSYGFDVLDTDGVLVADAAPVIRAVAREVRAGVRPEQLAARFHAGVVALIRELAGRVGSTTGLDVVCLGGGVFGNALLLSGARDVLERDGFTVLTPELVPANDGGIALGQLVVAAAGR